MRVNTHSQEKKRESKKKKKKIRAGGKAQSGQALTIIVTLVFCVSQLLDYD